MRTEKRGASYRIRKMIDGTTYSLTFDHKPTQKEIREELLKRMQKASEKASQSATFGVYAEKYIDDNRNILSPSTIRDYVSLINGKRIPQWFLDTPLDQVDSATTQRCISEYAATHAPKSTYNAFGFIRRVFVCYEPDRALRVNLPPREKYQKYVPTKAEVAQIFEHLRGTRYEVPYRLALYGLRMGEILALTMDDIDGNRVSVTKDMVLSETHKRVLKRTPKTMDSYRTILIDDSLAALIRSQGYIYNGDWRTLDDNLRRAQDACGVHRFRWHDLRAYMATELSAQGIDQKAIQAIGGWSDPSFMSRIYQKSRLDREPEKQEKIKNILSIC